MVVHFSSIPLHLQGDIAKKFDFFDLMEMELSSMHGKDVVQMIDIMPVAEVISMWFTQSTGYIYMNTHRHNEGLQIDLITLGQVPYLPRFAVSSVELRDDITPECVNVPIMNERNRFISINFTLNWKYLGTRKAEVLNKLTEVFTIKIFGGSPFLVSDREFLLLPFFRQLKLLDCYGSTFPDDLFLRLAETPLGFSVLASFPNMGPTLRAYVEHCFSNQGHVGGFNMSFGGVDERYHQLLTFESLFMNSEQTGLQYSLLWSMNTHESSTFARIPKTDVPTHVRNMRFYLITGVAKKMIVEIDQHRIQAREIEDENEEVMSWIIPGTFHFLP